MLDLIDAGKRVVELARQLGITAQTVYNWRKQDQIDRGKRAGLSTTEPAELTAARKRIREFETEAHWDPRRLMILETRMSHGKSQWFNDASVHA